LAEIELEIQKTSFFRTINPEEMVNQITAQKIHQKTARIPSIPLVRRFTFCTVNHCLTSTQNAKPVAMSKSRSPLMCPPRVQVKYPAALSRSRHLFNTYFLATVAQPSVIKVVGAVEGTSAQPALSEEVKNILQAIRKFA
jgi:hypothetical protein